MNSKYYSRLGQMAKQYCKSVAFTEYDLGKAIEQAYLMLLDEDMRDQRDIKNGRQSNV